MATTVYTGLYRDTSHIQPTAPPSDVYQCHQNNAFQPYTQQVNDFNQANTTYPWSYPNAHAAAPGYADDYRYNASHGSQPTVPPPDVFQFHQNDAFQPYTQRVNEVNQVDPNVPYRRVAAHDLRAPVQHPIERNDPRGKNYRVRGIVLLMDLILSLWVLAEAAASFKVYDNNIDEFSKMELGEGVEIAHLFTTPEFTTKHITSTTSSSTITSSTTSTTTSSTTSTSSTSSTTTTQPTTTYTGNTTTSSTFTTETYSTSTITSDTLLRSTATFIVSPACTGADTVATIYVREKQPENGTTIFQGRGVVRYGAVFMDQDFTCSGDDLKQGFAYCIDRVGNAGHLADAFLSVSLQFGLGVAWITFFASAFCYKGPRIMDCLKNRDPEEARRPKMWIIVSYITEGSFAFLIVLDFSQYCIEMRGALTGEKVDEMSKQYAILTAAAFMFFILGIVLPLVMAAANKDDQEDQEDQQDQDYSAVTIGCWGIGLFMYIILYFITAVAVFNAFAFTLPTTWTSLMIAQVLTYVCHPLAIYQYHYIQRHARLLDSTNDNERKA